MKRTREIPWKNKQWNRPLQSTKPQVQKGVIKMPKELRKIFDRNADHCNKELETIKRNQSKLDNSIAKIKKQSKSNE